MRQALMMDPSRPGAPLTLASAAVLLGCSGEAARIPLQPLPQAAQAEALSPPTIRRVQVEGPGCSDPDEVLSSLAGDKFRLSFGAFDAARTSRASSAEAECTLTVVLDAPDGVSYAPAGMDVLVSSESWTNRTADVNVATRGQWVSAVRTSGVRRVAFEAGGQTTRRIFDEPDLWSPCSGARELRVTTELQLLRRPGYARIEELSGLGFRARRCDDRPESGQDAGVPLDASAPVGQDGGAASDGGLQDGGEPPAPEPGEVSIEGSIELRGRGCTGNNQATVHLSHDRKVLEIDFPKFDFPPSEYLADCQIFFNVAAPPGQRAALQSFVLEGASELPAGNGVQLQAGMYFGSRVAVPRWLNFDFTGPTSGAFSKLADFTSIGLDFGMCRTVEPLRILLTAGVRQVEPTNFQVKRLHSLRFALAPCE